MRPPPTPEARAAAHPELREECLGVHAQRERAAAERLEQLDERKDDGAHACLGRRLHGAVLAAVLVVLQQRVDHDQQHENARKDPAAAPPNTLAKRIAENVHEQQACAASIRSKLSTRGVGLESGHGRGTHRRPREVPMSR